MPSAGRSGLWRDFALVGMTVGHGLGNLDFSAFAAKILVFIQYCLLE